MERNFTLDAIFQTGARQLVSEISQVSKIPRLRSHLETADQRVLDALDFVHATLARLGCSPSLNYQDASRDWEAISIILDVVGCCTQLHPEILSCAASTHRRLNLLAAQAEASQA